MANAFNKFNCFTRDVLAGAHRAATDTYKVMFTNTAPTAANAVKADILEITAQNGYVAGGAAVAATLSTSGGVAKLALADATITASGGSFGPWRYVVVYNDTQTSPAKPLVGWYDYGSSNPTNDGEPVKIDFDDAAGVLTLA